MEESTAKKQSSERLISEEYRKLNTELHETNKSYGCSGQKYADLVMQLVMQLKAKSVLDYGCGKCTLSNSLPQVPITNYDPCIEGLDEPPEPHEVVVCTDVLEHIEPEFVDNVINDLVRLTQKALFIQVATRPAQKTLSDGRNAHVSVHNAEWWMQKILPHLRMINYNRFGNDGFTAVFEHYAEGDDGTS